MTTTTCDRWFLFICWTVVSRSNHTHNCQREVCIVGNVETRFWQKEKDDIFGVAASTFTLHKLMCVGPSEVKTQWRCVDNELIRTSLFIRNRNTEKETWCSVRVVLGCRVEQSALTSGFCLRWFLTSRSHDHVSAVRTSHLLTDDQR